MHMIEGGTTKIPDKAIRYIALLGTPLFVGYNLLVMFGVAQSAHYVNDLICLIISALWLIVGVYHFFKPIRSQRDILWRFILYLLLAIATVLFITGFWTPFAASLTLLFLAANTYFGRVAFTLSVAAVVLAAFVDALIRGPHNPVIINENFISIVGILILGFAMAYITGTQETRRQALLKSRAQERLQYDRILTIINNLSDATITIDGKGFVQLYNAATLDLLDTNEDIKGRHSNELFALTDKTGEGVKLFDMIHSAEHTIRRDDLNHTYKDGDQIRLEMTYAPIHSADNTIRRTVKQTGYIIILRDVTKEKSLEDERDEFISVVSHELRTPITIIEGTLSNLQVLIDKDAGDKKTNSESVNMAHDQALYLAKMVNDLSTLSRAERGGQFDASEDIDVTELMHKMYDQYHRDAAAKGLELFLDAGSKLGTIRVSRLYVEELLQNFITNAIKYTQKGKITIIAKTKKGNITFTVKDTGLGISRTDQQKVFQKFYRSEDYRIRETSGTGLGLYVSSKLAKKLGTQIEFSSRLNHGSSFGFTLPQVDPSTEAPAEASKPQPTAQ